MINTSYQIKGIAPVLPSHAINIGKVNGHDSYLLSGEPHLFILNAFDKFYTIEYKNFGVKKKQPFWFDELSAFVESIKYLSTWNSDND